MLIEVFAEIACPFTHAGLRRLCVARDANRIDAPIRIRTWPLEWVNGAPLDPATVEREIAALRAEVAPDLFQGFDGARFPATTIPASGLAAVAYERDQQLGEAVSFALRTALFEEGRDLADAVELRSIAQTFDLRVPDAATGEALVRADWHEGQQRGVVGSPHFFTGDRDFFCPSLTIEHADDRFIVHRDADQLAEFYRTALGIAI